MLISPPFLTGKTKESDILETGLATVAAREESTLAPEGNYPVSQSFMWHTGMHLQAPTNNDTGYAPVRAIADGKVIFVNQPRPKVEDKTDGQAYNPYGTEATWTDNGMVVIEHETDIGAEGATATHVKFYSSYMHLSAIADEITPNKIVYRKDILGKTGVIYDHPGQMELSICCDHDNLKNLIGREPEWQDPNLVPTKDGRSDAVFGDIYIYLPSNTPTSSTAPTKHLRAAVPVAAPTSAPTATQTPSTPTAPTTEQAPATPVAPAPAANTLGTAQWVRINFGIDGATPGGCALTTYSVTGEKGNTVTDGHFEYKLYDEASTRHTSLGTHVTDSCPSGWYELLRFGRNLGRGESDKDLLPANAAHWRKIKTIDGREVWADLNAEGSYKFSDADFLPAMGWNCYHDDHDVEDQRCDSVKLRNLIVDPQDPGSINDEVKLAKRIGDTAVLPKLARTICKFPNEWDISTLDDRYKFMSERADIVENPGSWDAAKKHLQAMGISGLPAAFKDAVWHFHPAEFIRQFRKCGWLNNRELSQCFPRKHLTLRNTHFVSSTVTWQAAFTQADLWTLPFNIATRKYGVSNTKQRLLHFFAHVIPETGFLKLMKESDNASGSYLQSKPYWPYYGRGLIQLTWLAGYKKYGDFRGFPHTVHTGRYADLAWDPDVLIARSNTDYNANNCADCACCYVASYSGMVAKMDNGIAQSDAVDVSKCVNGDVAIQNLNGLEVRLQSILFLRDILLDADSAALTESMVFTWRRNSEKEPTGQLNAQGHPIKKFFVKDPPWEIQVSLEKQRP
ncbi:M23 family metallopeptidase [Collimonas humicola]|uniref:M23 family metallopeptidase n=1 Tax=Collimonas humicola TaxID=2825886 RepID=UPI001B8BAE5E|nr:M23 family metallopeptidase [Collimonas humicola]